MSDIPNVEKESSTGETAAISGADLSGPLGSTYERHPHVAASTAQQEVRSTLHEASDTQVEMPSEENFLSEKPEPAGSSAIPTDGCRKRKLDGATIECGDSQEQGRVAVSSDPQVVSTADSVHNMVKVESEQGTKIPVKKARVAAPSNLDLLLEASFAATPIPTTRTLHSNPEAAITKGPVGHPPQHSPNSLEADLPSSCTEYVETPVPETHTLSQEQALPFSQLDAVASVELADTEKNQPPETISLGTTSPLAEKELAIGRPGYKSVASLSGSESIRASDGRQQETASQEIGTVPEPLAPQVAGVVVVNNKNGVPVVTVTTIGATAQTESPVAHTKSMDAQAVPSPAPAGAVKPTEEPVGTPQEHKTSPPKGGIFDDADSVCEDPKLLAKNPKSSQTVSTEPLPQIPKVSQAVASPNPKGGIFDDADDDASFERPSYEEPARAIAMSMAMVPSTIDGPPGLQSKVVSTSMSNSFAIPSPVSPVAPIGTNGGDKATSTSKKSVDEKVNDSKKKKKKPTKPAKRVLVARKEKDFAGIVCKGKDDLTRILSEEHCQFLGKEFWIFTVQQLETILKGKSDADEAAESADPANLPKKNREEQLRRELVETIAKSELVPNIIRTREPRDAPGLDNEVSTKDKSETTTKATVSSENSNKDLPPEHSKTQLVPAGDASGSIVSSSEKAVDTGDTGKVDASQKMAVTSEKDLPAEQNKAKAEPTIDTPRPLISSTDKEAESCDTTTADAGEQSVAKTSEGKDESSSSTSGKLESDGPSLMPVTTNGSPNEEVACEKTKSQTKVPEETKEEEPDVAKANSAIEVDSVTMEAAEAISRGWQSKIVSWRASDKSENVPFEKQFLLSGPISCLLPTFAQRFLASVHIVSVYELLCLKKTETGAIIALCGAWRTECGLANATPLSLAKYFLGLGLRCEAAISSAVPIDKKTRRWLLDPICVLTGAAKEFAFDSLGIFSGEVFVERRTKDLAAQLAAWRTQKGLPPLKGSGKVAMISGWKAIVKEAIDLEQGDGKILTDVDLQALVETADDTPIVKEEKKKAPQVTKPASQQEFTYDPRIPDVEAALQSTQFLKDVLDPKHFATLHEAGIKNADDLFSAQKNHGSPLALAVSKILPDPSSLELVIFDWCQIVRKKLSRIRKTKRKDPPKAPASEPKAKKEKKEKPAETRPVVPPKLSRKDLLERDVFYSLSTVTQTFLRSLEISTAEAFMTSRTTDLSAAFVEWRAAHDMTVLKGLGAIASVSGWKAQVRKIARDRGLIKLAELGPPGSTAAVPTSSPGRKAKPKGNMSAVSNITSTLVGSSKRKVTRPDVLFGKSTYRVVVESTRDPRLRFFFELSIRKKTSGVGIFVTYQGAKRLQALSNSSFFVPYRYVDVASGATNMSLPVVKDISKFIKRGIHSASTPGKDVNVHFSSEEDGGGLIDLSEYRVGPLPSQAEVETALPVILEFITERTATEQTCPSAASFASNVVVGRDQDGKDQHFLYLKERMEKGQTLELAFCRRSEEKDNCSRIEVGGRSRSFVDGMIARLSDEGLRSLLEAVTRIVSYKVDSKLWGTGKEGNVEKDGTSHDAAEDSTLVENLIISRRRVHWVVFRIMSRLQELHMRSGTSQDDGATFEKDFVEKHSDLFWQPKLVQKIRQHPAWKESFASRIGIEIEGEMKNAIDHHPFLNSTSRQRWCSSGVELFNLSSKIISRFSTLLEDNSSQQIVAEIQEVAFEFAKELVLQEGDATPDLGKFLLTFDERNVTFKDSTPSQAYLFQTLVAQGYDDALALCNISACDVPLPKAKVRQVIATAAPTGRFASETEYTKSYPVEALFRSAEDAKEGLTPVNIAWYTRFQILLPLHSLLSSSFLVLESEGERPFKAVVMEGVETAVAAAGVPAGSWVGESRRSALGGAPTVYPGNVCASEYEPHSLPLFLGLVWPSLRSLHWRLDAGDSPSDVSFLPPGQKGRRQKGDKRNRLQKSERTKVRIKAAKASGEVGLGFLPKISKRLFVSAVEREALDLKVVREEKIVSVADALTRFVAKVVKDGDEADETLEKRVDTVVSYIRVAFDELFSSLLSDTVREEYEASGETQPSRTAGCEYLVRFLLVMPSFLSQAGLSTQLVEDTTDVMKELTSFLALNHVDLFDSKFHPPAEVYSVGERQVPAILASKLENLRSACDESNTEMMTETILPEDRPDLTDFVACVMEQIIPCRASQEDVEKKNRRIALGRVGLMCRHCLGARGEGRYFMMSVESITTAATVIEKHIAKCPEVPSEIKTRMVSCRKRHGDQRRNLAKGAQASYFLRLWERLRSSKVKDTAAALHILEMNEKEEEEEEEAEGEGLEFESHVRLVDYLSKTLPWREKPTLVEALDRYHEGLDLGHRVHTSHIKPKEFTSELVLAQMMREIESTEATD